LKFLFKKKNPWKSLNLQVLVVIPIWNGDTRHVYITVSDNTWLIGILTGKVYSIQHYALKFVSDLWCFYPVSSTNKTDCYDIITDILLKVALSTFRNRVKYFYILYFRTRFLFEYTLPWARFELTTLVVICTDCIAYHTVTTTTAPLIFRKCYTIKRS
jgi:hypothetical protein